MLIPLITEGGYSGLRPECAMMAMPDSGSELKKYPIFSVPQVEVGHTPFFVTGFYHCFF